MHNCPPDGAYELEFKSGKGYAGKGDETRAKISGKRISKENDDPLVSTKTTPASSTRESFKQESKILDKLGGPKSSSNYNKIESPGKNTVDKMVNKMKNFPNDDDGDILKRLYEKGVDLTLPRKLEFYCYAVDYGTAKKIAAKTALLGFVPEIYEDDSVDDQTKRFSVYNTIAMVPTYDAIVKTQKKLNVLLLNYDTRCDGWGTLFG